MALACAVFAPVPPAVAIPYPGAESPADLQTLIDRAEPESTVVVPAGTYRGPVVIDKPLQVLAEGDAELIVESGDRPAVTVTAGRVKIAGFTIRTASGGILLQGAGGGEITGNTVIGIAAEGMESSPDLSWLEMGNGIELYDSHDNRIAGNFVSGMHDAIYVENSHGNVIEQNRVEHSRYGIHLMYADRTAIRGNVGAYNLTGAMIMAASGTIAEDNTFYKQFENVHSQGILLFDAHNSRFRGNTVDGNRVGIYVEQSSGNMFAGNRIERNFVGVQLIGAEGNTFAENVFIGNVTDAEERSGSNNRIDGNYWDSFGGIDHDGDGASDMPNAINPFFQAVAARQPAFQLFFGSPGMRFLEAVFESGSAGLLTDSAPLMAPPAGVMPANAGAGGEKTGTLIPGIILLLVSLTTIYALGVRRS